VDLVILTEQLIEQRCLIGIKFGLFDLLSDAAVEIEAGYAELLAAVFVNEFDGGTILFRALEVVARDIVAVNAFGDLVLLEQRRSRGRSRPGARSLVAPWVVCR
jgi:hypothetical protein